MGVAPAPRQDTPRLPWEEAGERAPHWSAGQVSRDDGALFCRCAIACELLVHLVVGLKGSFDEDRHVGRDIELGCGGNV